MQKAKFTAPRSLLAGALIAALAACGTSETPDELLARAAEALAADQPSAAVIDIKSVLQQDPESVTARRMLAQVYYRQRNFAGAVDELERVRDRDESEEMLMLYARSLLNIGEYDTLFELYNAQPQPIGVNSRQFRAVLARALVQSGDLAEAEQILAALQPAPSDAAHVGVTSALLELRRGAGAEAVRTTLEELVQRHADSAEAWSLLGDLRAAANDIESAREAYVRAAELDPFRLGDRLKLVDTRVQLNELEVARAELAALEQQAPGNLGVALSRARLLLVEGSPAAAIEDLNKVLTAQPDNSIALYLAGMANAREGNLSTALRQLRRHIADQPGNQTAREQVAYLHLRLDDPAAAERVARDILQDMEDNPRAMRVLAVALGQQARHAESAQMYAKIATLEPEDVEARVGLSSAQLLAGEVDAGVGELEAALALEPENPALHERMISVYLATGAEQEARAAADAYLALDEANVRAHLIKGRVALQLGEKATADAAFRQALELEPGNADANGGLAALALLDADVDAARERFTDALSSSPDNLGIMLNLAIIEESAGNFEAMQGWLERAVAAHPEVLAPRLSLARFRLAQGEPRQAIELLDQVQSRNADSFAMHQLLAQAHLASGSPAGALSNVGALLRLQPSSPQALLLAARVEQATGRLELARKRLDQLLEQEPDSLEARGLLVENLLASGELAEAKAQIERLPEEVRARPRVQSVLGRIALNDQKFAIAAEHFRSALAAEPAGEYTILLSAAQWAQGNTERALSTLDGWLDEHPEDASVRGELANRLLALGRDDEALEAFNTFMEQVPDNPVVLNNAAWLERERDPERALALVRRADELAGESAQIKDTYAMVQLANGNVEEALALIDSALALAPEQPILELNRARILLAVSGAEAEAAHAEAQTLLQRLAQADGTEEAKQALELLQRTGAAQR